MIKLLVKVLYSWNGHILIFLFWLWTLAFINFSWILLFYLAWQIRSTLHSKENLWEEVLSMESGDWGGGSALCCNRNCAWCCTSVCSGCTNSCSSQQGQLDERSLLIILPWATFLKSHEAFLRNTTLPTTAVDSSIRQGCNFCAYLQWKWLLWWNFLNPLQA